MDVRQERTAAEEMKEVQTSAAGAGAQTGADCAGTKRWFGRGVYGSRDVPIRLLDGFIFLAIAAAVLLALFFSSGGGFEVQFDTGGGSEVAAQRLRHGEYAAEPEAPRKPGYEFAGWSTSPDEFLAEWWEFGENPIEDSMTLYAVWSPAQITVKFDAAGGTVDGSSEIPELLAVYGETYGTLPTPEKEGFMFGGWIYSGSVITEDTPVTMTGEHVLTAQWIS